MAKKSEGQCGCGSGMLELSGGGCLICRKYRVDVAEPADVVEEFAVPLKAFVPLVPREVVPTVAGSRVNPEAGSLPAKSPTLGQGNAAAGRHNTSPENAAVSPDLDFPSLIRAWPGTDKALAAESGVSWSTVMRAKRGANVSVLVRRALMEVLK